MKFVNKNQPIQRYQQGGPMPAEAPAPAPEQGAPAAGGDPMAQLLQVAAQALQTQNCEAAMAVCQALLQLAQGGPAPQQPAEPTFARNGAKLIRVRR